MKIAVAIALLLSAGVAARASDVQAVRAFSENDRRFGTVAIICPTEDQGVRMVSRGFAVRLGAVDHYDVVVASRHASGPAADSDITACSVRAPGGSYSPIADYRRAGVYHDEGDDWVVIRTATRLPAEVRRLPLVRLKRGSSLASHIAILANRPRTGCAVLIGHQVTLGRGRLFAHDCTTRPGLSGAPVVIAHNGQNAVIGFHVGQLMTAGGAESGSRGVGRWIDAVVEAAIVDLMASAD